MLYSPINYQGNKSRIVDKLLAYIPKGTTAIHEIFCGSAILSFASSVDNIHLNDTNHYILDLIEYFRTNTAEEIIKKTDNLISQYGLTNTYYEGRNNYVEEKHEGLSRYNKVAYNKLKSDYNNDKEVAKLFVLVIYGFNHFLRFNGKDEFNVPVGKVDFVESLRSRTSDYCKAVQSKKLKITNFDFRTPSLYETNNNNDLFYFDPPYLITQAPYNSFWNEKDEQELLDLLDNLNAKGYKFLLSNVVESNGKENTLLKEWMKKYNVKHIKRQYLNSSYQKKNLSDADEVIIYNYSEGEKKMAKSKKGTSGNRPGNKVFSFNTSVRNPKRNDEFLRAFQKYEGKVFNSQISHSYLCDLVKLGVYKFMDVPEYIKYKWNNDIDLTKEEIEELIKLNPQATGEHNRVMTSYMRSLKDQGFLIFKKDKESGKYYKIYLSELGKDLIDGIKDVSVIYTKAMLGIHASNPAREAMENLSRPFLNTIFVINEVNNTWSALGNNAKGVLKHEFSTFILSMKDCDYKKAASDIIEYRKKFKYELNMPYITKYLLDNNILPLAEKSIKSDYPDDVFRKFEMTGLLMKHGKSKYIYYNLSSYNIEKVNAILSAYKDYKYEVFTTQDDYYAYLENTSIPWEGNLTLRRKIAQAKAKYLGRAFNENIPLEMEEMQLDRAFYSSALSKAIDKINIKTIYKELLILSGTVQEESNYNYISEPLRLEYLIALALGKLYGIEGLVSNIIYNEDGTPMHCAVGNKCDILLFRQEGSYIIEPTMLCTRAQQENAETTSVARHAAEEKKKFNIDFRVAMIAPRVHIDVANYFCYNSFVNDVKMTTLSIDRTVGMLSESANIQQLNDNFDVLFSCMFNNQKNLEVYIDAVNQYVVDKTIYCE